MPAAKSSKKHIVGETENDDRDTLIRIAMLMALDPDLKRTTAIKGLGITNASQIRRLRDKFTENADKLIAAARRAQRKTKEKTTAPARKKTSAKKAISKKADARSRASKTPKCRPMLPHVAPVFARLCEPGSALISPKGLGDMLSMNLKQLAELISLHRNTISRNPASPEVQARLGEILRILQRATEISGDTNLAVYWFRNEIVPGFDGHTAEHVVAMGRADTVLKHLEMIEAGIAA